MKHFSRLILVCLAGFCAPALPAQTTTTSGTTTDSTATTATTGTTTPATTTTTTPTTTTTTTPATSTTTPATTSGTTGAVVSASTTTSGNLLSSSALVVYKLTFEVAGETINYRSYQGGYYIAPIEGGTGSLILTLTTGGVKTFYTYANFGELFVAVKGDDRKVVLDVSDRANISAALSGVFDSQISGGKRYDDAVMGRRKAHATFFESHAVDSATLLTFAMDLTPLVRDGDGDATAFALQRVRRLADDIEARLAKVAGRNG